MKTINFTLLSGCLFQTPFDWIGPAIRMEKKNQEWWVCIANPNNQAEVWFHISNVEIIKNQ